MDPEKEYVYDPKADMLERYIAAMLHSDEGTQLNAGALVKRGKELVELTVAVKFENNPQAK